MATYDITVRGTVQDVGFRDLVETLGRLHGLQGFVYNEPSGAVGITAQGSDEAVENFVAAVREQTERLSATVDAIERRPVDGDPSLPAGFFKAPTDELSDIGQKLDEGIQVLRDIRSDTSAIKEDTSVIKQDTTAIRGDTSLIPDIKDDTTAIRDGRSADHDP